MEVGSDLYNLMYALEVADMKVLRMIFGVTRSDQ